MIIYKEHFEPALPLDSAMQLFKNSVNNIEIEISSYCNRQCTYCPNAHYDRRTKAYMSDALFDSIIQQLSLIDYSERIAFHRYNEPLADFQYLLRRIAQTKEKLPRCELTIYTNGDYLTKKTVSALENSGVDVVIATSHYKNSIAFTQQKDHTLKKIIKLSTPFKIDLDDDTQLTVLIDSPMKFYWRCVNYLAEVAPGQRVASDRCGANDFKNKRKRTAACLIPFSEMQISYQVYVLPCCNIYPEAPEHKPFIISELDASSNLFQIYAGPGLSEWREALFHVGNKRPPCDTCNYRPGSLTDKKLVERIRAELTMMDNV
ncbi:radical SAM protein (plasmid) [Edwardsiella tarda]|uniref:radical SAM/SPASM domain-containing protein n=1 Tax=Edwardsiella tarda TaxID=636 RepID=UPI0024440B24|nr:radical SAM/SPASM domain-containing protein [Edwardsiella tarda]WGE30844.1 radical SAM protein [Edwardsiella tarda]